MARYNVNIGSTTNILGDPRFFFGTSFLGENFDTREELLALMRKYATFKKDGESYWREEIKLTFDLAENISSLKEDGDRQCKENGFVNLFALCARARKNPFEGISIIYRPGAWIDKDGREFKFVLIKGEEVIPKAMKLSEILREIGMDI